MSAEHTTIHLVSRNDPPCWDAVGLFWSICCTRLHLKQRPSKQRARVSQEVRLACKAILLCFHSTRSLSPSLAYGCFACAGGAATSSSSCVLRATDCQTFSSRLKKPSSSCGCVSWQEHRARWQTRCAGSMSSPLRSSPELMARFWCSCIEHDRRSCCGRVPCMHDKTNARS